MRCQAIPKHPQKKNNTTPICFAYDKDLEQLDITEKDRDVTMIFDGEKITIQKKQIVYTVQST